MCIYLTARHIITPTWLNDRDQFLYPNNKWESDKEFQNDCLAFALFHGQNKISAEKSTNHWIPFTENEVDAKDKFESHFMTKFIKGKIEIKGNGTLLETQKNRTTALKFSTKPKRFLMQVVSFGSITTNKKIAMSTLHFMIFGLTFKVAMEWQNEKQKHRRKI